MSKEHEGMKIELLDLGDATVETKQWTYWPYHFDSQYGRGARDF